jgi:molybdopterin-guanine dinucleotide biosynthesis protein A
MEISGIVLAGGKGLRFGGNKPLAKIGSKTLIEVVVERIEDLFTEVMIVGGSLKDVLPHLRHFQDIGEWGPLGGIYVGLLHSRTEYNFVLGCDMPFVNRRLVRYMMEEAEGKSLVVPISEKGPEPLHSIYSKRCLPYIEAQIKKGIFKITELFKTMEDIKYIEGVEWAEESFFNVNTQEDLITYLERRQGDEGD